MVLLVPTKSYIWGWITGVLVILIGILSAFVAATNFQSDLDIEMSVDSAKTRLLVGLAISIVVVADGILILLKKAVGWYLQYLFLFLAGAFLLILISDSLFQDISDSLFQGGLEIHPPLLTLGAIGVFCFMLLWIQIRYWRSRRA